MSADPTPSAPSDSAAPAATSTPVQSARVTRAWISGFATAACLVIWFGLNCEENAESPAALEAWGYKPAEQVWRGAWWALVTSAFVHIEIVHIGFNAYWLWVLGSRMERVFGSLRFAVFVAASAFVSSAFQMALSDAAGIGISGVVYAIFGFMVPLRQRIPQFREVLPWRIVSLFISWMMLCALATAAKFVNIGNVAHASGMLFGGAVAAVFVTGYRPRLMRAGLAALCLLPIQFLLWCPWSVTWLGIRAYDAHVAGDYGRAIDYYTRVLRRDPANAWAAKNRDSAIAAMEQIESGLKALFERARRGQ